MRTKLINSIVTPDSSRNKGAPKLVMTPINLPEPMSIHLKTLAKKRAMPVSVLVRLAIVQVYGDDYALQVSSN